MRHLPRLVLLALVLAACSNGNSSPNPGSASAITQPDGTVPAPGSCVAGQILPDVSLIVDGTTVRPTFGIGSSECVSLTGSGYIAFDYDPLLIDTRGPVEVVVNGDATVTFAWQGGEPFTNTAPGRWRSSVPATGCSRLTVGLVSPSGTSSETFGADIRVGGTTVECTQRGLGPTEPIDTSVIITEAPDTTVAKARPGKVVDTTVTSMTNP